MTGKEYRFIECFHAPHCTENAPFQAVVRGVPRQLCARHIDEHERHLRWEARGKPTAAESIEKMKQTLRQPQMTNLERAHVIIARGNCGQIAEDWAKDFIAQHQRGETQ